MAREIDHYIQQSPYSEPELTVTIYGYPLTVDKFPGKRGQWSYRVAVWLDERDVKRTKPLVEERFDADVFHQTVHEYAGKAHMRMMPQGGVTECFMVEWFSKNRRTIEEAAQRRRLNSSAFTDLGQMRAPTSNGPIPTRTFVGEDGQTHHELDLRGEDTDPVLLEATKDRERILKAKLEEDERQRAEALRKIKDAQARKEREQTELESLPGFASF